MITQTKTLLEIRQLGLAALSRELGSIGMVRFLQQSEIGEGNYSTERHQWLDNISLEQALQQILELRRPSKEQ